MATGAKDAGKEPVEVKNLTIKADMNVEAETEPNRDDIDYMHPDGKPQASKSAKEQDENEKKFLHSTQKSIDEADGHHMCSSQCRDRHRRQ